MTRILTAMFDARGAAEDVVKHLVEHDGVERSRLSIHGQGFGEAASAGALPAEQTGLWATLLSLFMPDEDRSAFSEGIRRGHYLVSAEVEEGLVPHAIAVFESHGAIDLDAHEADWRRAGWQGHHSAATAVDTNYMTGARWERQPVQSDAESGRVRSYTQSSPRS